MKKKLLNLVRRICGTQKLNDELSELKKMLNALNHNLIQLGIGSETVYFSDGNKIFPLYRDDKGKLSFTLPSSTKEHSDFPGIIVVTLPKSGTHLWVKILEECGFVPTGIFSHQTTCGDFRNITDEDFFQSPENIPLYLPFYLQVQCLKKGEILPGHMDFSCAKYVQGHPILISKRDFRTAAISLLRHSQRFKIFSNEPWYSLGATEEALHSFIQSKAFALQIQLCKEIIKWEQAFPDHVVRYEDLEQPGSAEYAGVVEKLSRITGLDADRVSSAIERAHGAKTFTYSGKKSSLDGIWSDRVEERFQELQGHILNEQMGYPRDWKRA